MTDEPIALDVAAFAELRQSGRDYAILDVREPWEWAICAFPHSLLISLQQIPGALADLPRDRPLIIVCHHGMRSLQATMWLRRNGLTNALNLEGGINAWAHQIEPEMGVY